MPCDVGYCAPPIRHHSIANSQARRVKGNDDAQDRCVGLRAGGYRDHAQGQARHATGAAAPRSGNRDHASAKAPERLGPPLNSVDDEGQPMPLSTFLPFALVAVIGMVVFYAVYRAGV